MRVAKLAVAVLIFACCAFGQQAATAGRSTAAVSGRKSGFTVKYAVTLVDPSQHILHIEMWPEAAPDAVVQMPAWYSLYQVRDFSQYILSFAATDVQGRSVPWRKLDKTTWSVPNAVKVEYDIYVDLTGPFNAQFNSDHAFLNLPEVLMYDVKHRYASPVAVSFRNVPQEWQIATVLDRVPSQSAQFTAPDYDAMSDAPVEMGRYHEIAFDDQGTKYRIALDGDRADYEDKAIENSIRRIVRVETDWMQDHPCREYLFIYHVRRGPAGGGMEHGCGTAIDVSADSLKQGLEGFQSVSAHEFFHLWNVKRIRPQSLEPIDYTKEQYTRALWFSEGLTSTMDAYFMRLAGFYTEQQYLQHLAREISNLQRRPAHKTQSVEESSLDTWYDKYPFYGRPERSISYYNKGEVLGVMLDLAIRDATAGKKSLRDLFLWMNEHYARQGRFFNDSQGVQDAVEKITGKDFGWFFQAYVAGIDEVPYDRLLNTAGLKLEQKERRVAYPGFTASRNFGSTTVAAVDRGSDAEQAGLKPGDVIVAVNGKADISLGEAVSAMSAGETLRLKIRGRGAREDRDLAFPVGDRTIIEYSIGSLDKPTQGQLARRAEWLSTQTAVGAADALVSDDRNSAQSR